MDRAAGGDGVAPIPNQSSRYRNENGSRRAGLVIISLFFWHAVWGIPGALLAVPFLAMFKIICDRIEPLQPAGHIIGA